MSMTTVLVVEDDKIIRRFVALNLRMRQYEVWEAGTVQEGLSLLRQHNPDLLILDLMLPEENGWTLLRAIDSDPALPHLRTIIMSAATQEDMYEYPYSDIVGILRKPFGLPDLMNMIRLSVTK